MVDKTSNTIVKKPKLKHGLHESERYFGRWIYLAHKRGGKHDSGMLGGVFLSSHNNKRQALFKHEKRAAKVLGEFLAGELWEAVTPEYSARTFLATHHPKVALPDKTGGSVYIGSLWIDGYKELYLDIEEQRKKEGLPMPKWWPHKHGKVSFARLLNQVTGFFSHAFSSYGYKGFPQVMVTSLLLADFGVHSANVGVVREKGKDPKLMRIDYGSSFKGIDQKDIHPNSRSRHIPIIQKGGGFSSNYFAVYPKLAKVTAEFAAELDRVAAFDFKPKIKESLEYAGEYFDRKVFQKFAKRIGMEVEQYTSLDKKDIIDNVGNYLAEKVADRQISLKEYASQTKTDLSIWRQNGQWLLTDYKDTKTGKIVTFEETVRDNAQYFRDIVHGKKPVHFRESIHKSSRHYTVLSRLVRETAAEILGESVEKTSHVQALKESRAADVHGHAK